MTAAMLIAGILTVAAAGGVVFSPKSLHSALWLVVTFFLVAVHYALVGADFIAALQVLVYAGAIMVLVVFVIMLLGPNEQGEAKRFDFSVVAASLASIVFVALVFFVVRHPEYIPSAILSDPRPVADSSANAIGDRLFRHYLFPFEIVSLLLLAAMIGAVVLVHDKKQPLPAGRGLRAKRTADGLNDGSSL